MISFNISRRKAQVATFALLAAVTAVVGVTFTSSALAQTGTLTTDQTAAVDAVVQAALAGVDPALTGAARQQAIARALVQAAAQVISTFGVGAVASVMNTAIAAGVSASTVVNAVVSGGATAAASAVAGGASAGGAVTVSQVTQAAITVAAQMGVPNNVVGQSLGQAAASLAQSSPGAATQVAQVVANEGATGTGQAFSASVTASGGTAQLANAALQPPALVTGAVIAPAVATTTATALVAASSQVATGTGTTVSCTNPSCN